MNIYNVLLKLANEHIENLKDIYRWKINLTEIPCEFSIESRENLYEQNLKLRLALHNVLLSTDSYAKRYEIIRWYIHTWGGVKTNRESTLQEYAIKSESPEELIKKGDKGIASWSKVLSIIDPRKYAIYDARVASSLNSIQIIYKVKEPVYYPTLSSRNKVIVKSNRDRKNIKKQWVNANKIDFYHDYLSLLNQVAIKSDNDITVQDIEMLLFALAETLVKRADSN